MAQCGRKWPNVILGGGKVIPKYRNCNLFNRQRRKKMLRFWPEKKCQQKVSFYRCFGKKNLKEMMCEAIFLKKVISCFQLIGSQGQQQLPTQRDQRYRGPLQNIIVEGHGWTSCIPHRTLYLIPLRSFPIRCVPPFRRRQQWYEVDFRSNIGFIHISVVVAIFVRTPLLRKVLGE